MESLIRESDINESVQCLPGIGRRKSVLLGKLGIFTVSDLLNYYPRAYKDTKHFFLFDEIARSEKPAAGIAEIISINQTTTRRGLLSEITAKDSAGNICRFPLFNRTFPISSFPPGEKFYFFGKIQPQKGCFKGSLIDFEKVSTAPVLFGQILPVYPLTAGISSLFMIKIVREALRFSRNRLFFRFPEHWQFPFTMIPYADAVSFIHFPPSQTLLRDARKTLGYIELYRFAAGAFAGRESRHSDFRRDRSACGNLSPLQQQIITSLPFDLTSGQKQALKEINRDLDSREVMQRLLQGDVGCGKTLVAFLAAARVIESGRQCALMVPTELLAAQHAEKAFSVFHPFGINVSYYTGSLKTDSKKNLLKPLKKGEIDLIIGTHALFSDHVEFKNLGLVIIDEQHKFGVLQRASLFAKGNHPDILMMSATPIPRSLAQTLYTYLDISSIEDLPRERIPVKTHLAKIGNEQKVYDFVYRELKAGHQAYFVYPLIEENGQSPLKDSQRMAETLQTQVFPSFRTALIHSRLDEKQKTDLMHRFSAGDIDILVSTTVVEVGIDNPNATVMVIENAQQFGLSTLHQLRGRIGRSKLPSFCFLVYNPDRLSEDGKKRLKILAESNDGFKIAQEDLRMRGPGELFGERQTGLLRFKIADPFKEKEITDQIVHQLRALTETKSFF